MEILKINFLHTHLQIQVIPRMDIKPQVPGQFFSSGVCSLSRIKTINGHMTTTFFLAAVTVNTPPHYCALFARNMRQRAVEFKAVNRQGWAMRCYTG